MTKALRRRHRTIMLSLAVVLPLAFTAGVALRRTPHEAQPTLTALAAQDSSFWPVVWSSHGLWATQKIATNLRRNSGGAVAVELRWRDLQAPGLLLYWIAGKPSSTAELPKNARLLGTANFGSPTPFPEELRGETGTFILYSLPNSEIVAQSSGFIIQRR